MNQNSINHVQPARHWRRRIIIGFVMLLVLTFFYFSLRNTVIASLSEAIIAPDKSNPVAYGKVLFGTRGCGGCHTLADAGSSGREGPILTGIGTRHSYDYLQQVITDPSTIKDATYPNGPCQTGIMPVWGKILDPSQIDALAQYLSQQK